MADTPDTLPPSGDGSSGGPPKGLKRRLRWSTRGGEIIRSDGPHEVSVTEGSADATARLAIPQSEEPRALGKDRIAYGPTRAGVSSRDRFETGQGEGSGPRDRFESGQGSGEGARDRFQGGPAPDSPVNGGGQGPLVGAERLNDRFAGGDSGGGITDRMQGGGSPSDPRPSGDGPTVAPTAFNDFFVGGPGTPSPSRPRQGPQTGSHFEDRNAGGPSGQNIEDRMQGGPGADAYSDRYQGADLPGGPTDRYAEVPAGGGERDRLDLPEDAQIFTDNPHRGSRKPVRVDDLLRQVPKPVFQPVEIFKDIQGLSKRMTGIRSETADIRGKLSPALTAAVPEDPSRKVSQWLKKKLPK